MINKIFHLGLVAFVGAVYNCSFAIAESISELNIRGEHYKAVSYYYDSKTELTLSDRLAAAKSAWALSDVVKARELWQEVLADKDLVGEERSRTVLSLAILELQEGNFEQARAYAEKEANSLEPSELRGEFWLLIAEALREQKVYSLAEQYYKKSIGEGSEKVRYEAYYLQAKIQYNLGLIDDSRYSFTQVALGSEYAFPAIKNLITIDYSQKNYQGVLNWVEEIKENYSHQLKDPEISYYHISSLINLDNKLSAKKELEQFKITSSESNPWYALASAAVEMSHLNTDLNLKNNVKR